MARRLPSAKTKPVPPFSYASCTPAETSALQLLERAFGKLTTLRPQDIPVFSVPSNVRHRICPNCMTPLHGPDWFYCGFCRWREGLD